MKRVKHCGVNSPLQGSGLLFYFPVKLKISCTAPQMKELKPTSGVACCGGHCRANAEEMQGGHRGLESFPSRPFSVPEQTRLSFSAALKRYSCIYVSGEKACVAKAHGSPHPPKDHPTVPSPNCAPRLVRDVHVSAVVVSQLLKKQAVRGCFYRTVVLLFS